MFGCDEFRYYPLRGLEHGDTHTIGWHTYTVAYDMARRNAVIMRGFAAYWHRRDLNISLRGALCVNGLSAVVPTISKGWD